MRQNLLSVTLGLGVVACSSGEHGKDVGKTVAPLAARTTLSVLKTFPDIAPRVTGVALARGPFGFGAELDPHPIAVAGPHWVDTRDLPTGFHATLPARGGQPMHVGVSDSVWFELAAEGDAHVDATLVDRALVLNDAAPDTDVVLTADVRHVEEVRLLRSPRAPSVLRYRLRLGPGVSNARVREGMIELLDERGVARLRSDRWFAVDAEHRRIDLEPRLTGQGSDRVLEAHLPLSGARFPVAVDPGWGVPTTLAVARRFHTVTALPSGKVLVVGGETTGPAPTSSAELFDPTTSTWTIVKAMGTPRQSHAAVPIAGNKVFVIGSWGQPTCSVGSTSEVYDVATDTWSAGPSMAIPRGQAGVALLSSGKIFVGAGRTCGGPTDPSNTADVWDPGTNTFKAATGTMSGQHGAPVAGAFGTDKAFVAGGWPGYGATSNAEIYDGATNAVGAAPKMSSDRNGACAATLTDGRTLVIGGANYSSGYYAFSTVEAFLPSTGTFSLVAPMPTRRWNGIAATLGDGKVLVAMGGDGATTSYAADLTSLLYDPTANTWTNVGNVGTSRAETAMAPLPGNGAIVPGGRTGSNTPVNTVEIWANAVIAGGRCTSNAQCTSGSCVDGVCCDRACTGTCEACNESGSVGTCKLVTGAPRAPRTACTGTGTCGGTCDGVSSSCTYPTTSVTCSAATCIGGVGTGAAYCNGAGACGTVPASITCAPYACGATAARRRAPPTRTACRRRIAIRPARARRR